MEVLFFLQRYAAIPLNLFDFYRDLCPPLLLLQLPCMVAVNLACLHLLVGMLLRIAVKLHPLRCLEARPLQCQAHPISLHTVQDMLGQAPPLPRLLCITQLDQCQEVVPGPLSLLQDLATPINPWATSMDPLPLPLELCLATSTLVVLRLLLDTDNRLVDLGQSLDSSSSPDVWIQIKCPVQWVIHSPSHLVSSVTLHSSKISTDCHLMGSCWWVSELHYSIYSSSILMVPRFSLFLGNLCQYPGIGNMRTVCIYFETSDWLFLLNCLLWSTNVSMNIQCFPIIMRLAIPRFAI